VINVHHTNQTSRGGAKLNSTSGRGVTGLFDGARWQCGLAVDEIEFDDADLGERLGEVVVFGFTKNNYAKKLRTPLLLRRADEFEGALVPLDEDDIEIVEEARARTATSTPRREARKAEAQSEAARQDEAAVRAVIEQPGINWGKLCTRIAAIAGCGEISARKAIERMAHRFDIKDGPSRSKLYYPKPTP
jgi:hypothetical protein